MNVDLFQFQMLAVQELRNKASNAIKNYRDTSSPQVISLQAPTGSGKTIIMASFIEDVFYGTEDFVEQPNAIFVWLSDSPQLNEQSKDKITKFAKVKFNQCITVSDDNFDQETFDDGKIYFINTQKIGKAGNLTQTKDGRNYTIWETIENTTKQKSDRLYFIIDEAHRGMLGTAAGKATSIMQRFLIGDSNIGLSPVPLAIGVSATPARFNALFGNTTSTLNFVRVSAAQVRDSGLLKERIVITYPDDTQRNNDMAVLDAAVNEWMSKAIHWKMYCDKEHTKMVNPVFVIQVRSGSNGKVSDTNLEDIIVKIEEKIKRHFNKGEVVHTFGDLGTLKLNGLEVEHIEPNDIVDDKRVKVVLFKENLSTGWDCPRAETMMSFRTAEDVTYIAQLLGRMVRTPLQTRIKADETLNEVRMFLPYFNKENVEMVIKELLESECGDIAPFVDSESIERPNTQTLTVHVTRKTDSSKEDESAKYYEHSLFDDWFTAEPGEDGKQEPSGFEQALKTDRIVETVLTKQVPVTPINNQNNQSEPPKATDKQSDKKSPFDEYIHEPTLFGEINRPEVTKFINQLGLISYNVKPVRINSYLKSLCALAALLTREGIDRSALATITKDIVEMIHSYIQSLKDNGKYKELVTDVLTFKLSIKMFDMFGEDLYKGKSQDFYTTSNSEIEMQLRNAENRLANFGFTKRYGEQYFDPENPDDFKIDCILFVLNDDCMEKLNKYAEAKFHELDDNNRRVITSTSESLRREYDTIITNGDAISKHSFTLPEEVNFPDDYDGTVYDNHLFADSKTGKARIKLDSSWESGVIEEEARNPDFVCWIRNKKAEKWALCIPYEINNETRATYPDFLVIRKDEKTGYVVDILEPHNPNFTDNLPKAKGFAKYAEQETKIGRFQLIRKTKDGGVDKFVRLDFSKGEIRKKVLAMQTTEELNHLFDTDGVFEN